MSALPSSPRPLKHGLLRPVTAADAELIVSLRSRPEAQRFLAAAAPDIGQQRAWLESYRKRNAKGEEYYFRLEDRQTGRTVILFRIYAVVPFQRFEWGSWIAAPDAPKWAAISSWLAAFDFGFFQLGCPMAYFRTMTDNSIALKFCRRFNSRHLKTEDGHEYFSLDAATYLDASREFGRFFLSE